MPIGHGGGEGFQLLGKRGEGVGYFSFLFKLPQLGFSRVGGFFCFGGSRANPAWFQ